MKKKFVSFCVVLCHIDMTQHIWIVYSWLQIEKCETSSLAEIDWLSIIVRFWFSWVRFYIFCAFIFDCTTVMKWLQNREQKSWNFKNKIPDRSVIFSFRILPEKNTFERVSVRIDSLDFRCHVTQNRTLNLHKSILKVWSFQRSRAWWF